MRGKSFVGIVTPLIAILSFAALEARGDDIAVQPQRTLVVVVHGTQLIPGVDVGNWMKVVPGKATFASEIQRAMGPGSEIYSFMWSGALLESAREEAAVRLAKIIDEKGANFDRICLVGHSHGGNVALLAAGECHYQIDTVVCLATPHFYLERISQDRLKLFLPVHCTWQARGNIKQIINVYTRFDEVPTGWASLIKDLGLTRAIALTRSWEDHLVFAHLSDDLTARLMSRVVPEIPTSVWLNVADINQPIESMAPGGPADWTGHSEIHCLRVGYTLGELLRDGPTPHEMSYISTLVLPQWCDEGEPTPERYLFDMLRQHSDDLQQVGWRLDKVDVQLDPAVKLITGPHFIVSLHMSADRFPFTWHAYPSPMSKDTLTPSWTSNFILANGQSGLLSLRSGIDGKSLGTFHFAAGDQPPSTLNADPSTGQFWSASLEWTPVHF